MTAPPPPQRLYQLIRIRTHSGWPTVLSVAIVYKHRPRFKGVFRWLNRYTSPKTIPYLRVVDKNPPYSVPGKARAIIDYIELNKATDWNDALAIYLKIQGYT